MKYTKIPTTTFENLQLNAGILTKTFVPSTGAVDESAIIGATSGGVNFTATPSFSDSGEDIDNCPKNMMELKKLDEWEITISGTFTSATTSLIKSLIGPADIDGTDTTKIVPRNVLETADFSDLWWVGDYSDKNGTTNGGYMAIHLMNALSTGGFQIQSGDKAKGQMAFTYTSHFSNASPDTVPFEVYLKAGIAEPAT